MWSKQLDIPSTTTVTDSALLICSIQDDHKVSVTWRLQVHRDFLINLYIFSKQLIKPNYWTQGYSPPLLLSPPFLCIILPAYQQVRVSVTPQVAPTAEYLVELPHVEQFSSKLPKRGASKNCIQNFQETLSRNYANFVEQNKGLESSIIIINHCIIINASYNYTGCPTRYRTRRFFNNFTTNEDIATKF